MLCDLDTGLSISPIPESDEVDLGPSVAWWTPTIRWITCCWTDIWWGIVIGGASTVTVDVLKKNTKFLYSVFINYSIFFSLKKFPFVVGCYLFFLCCSFWFLPELFSLRVFVIEFQNCQNRKEITQKNLKGTKGNFCVCHFKMLRRRGWRHIRWQIWRWKYALHVGKDMSWVSGRVISHWPRIRREIGMRFSVNGCYATRRNGCSVAVFWKECDIRGWNSDF